MNADKLKDLSLTMVQLVNAITTVILMNSDRYLIIIWSVKLSLYILYI